MKQIYGRKVGMTQVFTEAGLRVPVTVLELGPNVVFQVKTEESDGYQAVQVGFGEQKQQRVNRALTGHFTKAKQGLPRFCAEIRLDETGKDQTAYNVGDVIEIKEMFQPGDRVDVTGTTIGKGFGGVMKRHKMKGAQTNTHGTHEYFRHAGSIGCRKFPGRVWKNKRMPGHMGVTRRTQERVEVVAIRPDENLMLVKGSVPGAKNSFVCVRGAVKA